MSLTDEEAAQLATELRAALEDLGAATTRAMAAMAVAADELADEENPEPTLTVEASAVPRAGAIDVTWTHTGTVPDAWVVSRDGKDTSGYGPWAQTLPPSARSMTLDKLLPGTTYTVTVAGVDDGGTLDQDTVTVKTPTPVPGPVPPTGRVIPLVGRSGDSFNHIAFLGSPDLAAVEKFGTDRGRPFDGMLWFTEREGTDWGQFRRGLTSAHRDWLEAGRLIVTSMPHAPAGLGTSINRVGAENGYAQQQRDYGRWLVENGFNHPLHVIRVDWEFNGDWYPWSAKNGGGDMLRRAVSNFIANVRAGGATKVAFDMCGNKGPSQAGVWSAAIPPEVDVLGLDQYDHWAPSLSADQWKTETQRTPGLATVRAEAAKRGVMWSIDECGNSWSNQSGGYDNPRYWQYLRASLDEDPSRLAWLCTYEHDGAPATLKHSLRQYNPSSWAVYKRLFGGGA